MEQFLIDDIAQRIMEKISANKLDTQFKSFLQSKAINDSGKNVFRYSTLNDADKQRFGQYVKGLTGNEFGSYKGKGGMEELRTMLQGHYDATGKGGYKGMLERNGGDIQKGLDTAVGEGLMDAKKMLSDEAKANGRYPNQVMSRGTQDKMNEFKSRKMTENYKTQGQAAPSSASAPQPSESVQPVSDSRIAESFGMGPKGIPRSPLGAASSRSPLQSNAPSSLGMFGKSKSQNTSQAKKPDQQDHTAIPQFAREYAVSKSPFGSNSTTAQKSPWINSTAQPKTDTSQNEDNGLFGRIGSSISGFGRKAADTAYNLMFGTGGKTTTASIKLAAQLILNNR